MKVKRSWTISQTFNGVTFLTTCKCIKKDVFQFGDFGAIEKKVIFRIFDLENFGQERWRFGWKLVDEFTLSNIEKLVRLGSVCLIPVTIRGGHIYSLYDSIAQFNSVYTRQHIRKWIQSAIIKTTLQVFMLIKFFQHFLSNYYNGTR